MNKNTEFRIKELNSSIMNAAAAGPQSRMLALQLVHSCVDYGYVYVREDYIALANAIEDHRAKVGDEPRAADLELYAKFEEVESSE